MDNRAVGNGMGRLTIYEGEQTRRGFFYTSGIPIPCIISYSTAPSGCPPGTLDSDADSPDHERLRTVEAVQAAFDAGHRIYLTCGCRDANGRPLVAGLATSYTREHPAEPYARCQRWSSRDCFFWSFVHQLPPVAKKCLELSVASGQATVSPTSFALQVLLRAALDLGNPQSEITVPTWSSDHSFVAEAYKILTGHHSGDDSTPPELLHAVVSLCQSVVIAGTRHLGFLADVERGCKVKKYSLSDLLVPPPLPRDLLASLKALAIEIKSVNKDALVTPLPRYDVNADKGESLLGPHVNQAAPSSSSSASTKKRPLEEEEGSAWSSLSAPSKKLKLNPKQACTLKEHKARIECCEKIDTFRSVLEAHMRERDEVARQLNEKLPEVHSLISHPRYTSAFGSYDQRPFPRYPQLDQAI
ncbi:hypothetical protein JCM3770_004778 [Rhodotorula araucariae]